MTQGPEGYETNPDQEAVDQQVRALEQLQCPEHKRQLENEVIQRRQDPEEPVTGMRRVRVERARKLTRDGDDLLVVAREIIATPMGDAVLEDHDLERIEVPKELCCDLKRYRIRGGRSVTTVVDDLRRAGFASSANHAVMLGNTSKGGDSPAATNHPLGDLKEEQAGDTALIIVIDTGLDPAGPGRGDGWLDDVRAQAADHDPLDEVHPNGRRPKDGLLDLAAGHGTFVTGTIRRVEPNANIIVLRALDTEGMAGEDLIALAICRAGEIFAEEPHNGRGVLNLSLGIETIDDLPPLAIECALRELPPEVVVVAAAGNEPSRRPLWPAASKRVVAVAGLCDNLAPTSWSNRGSFVDFSTRAEGIVSTFVNGEETPRPGQQADEFPTPGQTYSYAAWTGTSFATPQVAARIARYMADKPDQPVEAVVQRLRDEGTYRPEWGYVVEILEANDPPLRCSTAQRPILQVTSE